MTLFVLLFLMVIVVLCNCSHPFKRVQGSLSFACEGEGESPPNVSNTFCPHSSPVVDRVSQLGVQVAFIRSDPLLSDDRPFIWEPAVQMCLFVPVLCISQSGFHRNVPQ